MSPPTANWPRTLFVDDDPALRAIVPRMLQRRFPAARVRTAADGVEALQLIDSYRPAMVITDLDMPRLGGLDLCRLLRARAELHALTLVVATGHVAFDLEARVRRAGADALLRKPWTIRQLVARAWAAHEQRRAA